MSSSNIGHLIEYNIKAVICRFNRPHICLTMKNNQKKKILQELVCSCLTDTACNQALDQA